MNSNTTVHVYRPPLGLRVKYILLYTLATLMILFMLAIGLASLVARLSMNMPIGIPLIAWILLMSGLIVFFTAPTALGVALLRLEISSSGLRFVYWPNYVVNATWAEVDYLGQGTTGVKDKTKIITYDVLYLKDAKVLEVAPTMKLRRLVFNPSKQYFIPLTRFDGWPEGELANDIRRYAPHVFKNVQES